MHRKGKHTRNCRPDGSNTKRGEALERADDAVLVIEKNQITGREQAEQVDRPGMLHPFALIVAPGASRQEPRHMRKRRISLSDAQAQKAFAGLVVYAVLWPFHNSSLKTSAEPGVSMIQPVFLSCVACCLHVAFSFLLPRGKVHQALRTCCPLATLDRRRTPPASGLR